MRHAHRNVSSRTDRVARRADASSREQRHASGQPVAADSIDDRWNALMAAAQGGDDRAYERLMGEVSQWLSRYFHTRLPP
ncbi:MAG: hypothetical protein ACM3IG_06580, partial [Myxococcales bacterium]